MPGNSSAISSLGVGSGLDLGSLLGQIKSSEQARLAPLQHSQQSAQTKLSAYGKIQDGLDTLQDAAKALGKASTFSATQALTNAKAFAASSGEQAVPGQYNVKVGQLAQAQSLATGGRASDTDTIGAGGTLTLSLGDASGNPTQSVDIDLAQSDSSLNGIRDAINGADIGINASIINDGSAAAPYRLVLSAQDAGTDSQISVAASDAAGGDSALADLLDYDSASSSGSLEQKLPAKNANFTVNGIPIASQSNTVEDAIQGVTLSLKATSSSSERLTTARDTGAVKSALSKFVKAYNGLSKLSGALTQYNGPDSPNGVLLGDATTRSVENRLRGALNTPGFGGKFSGLAEIGVALQKDGSLAIDAAKLDDALQANPGDVEQLLTGGDSGDGVAGALAHTLARIGGEHGLIHAASQSTQNRIDRLDDRADRMQDRIDATIDRQREQFVQLDSVVASLNSTQSYLSTQLAKLDGSSGGGGGGGLF